VATAQEDYIRGEYVPIDYVLLEPTRINLASGLALLDFWRSREKKGATPLEFEQYKTVRGEILPAKQSARDLYMAARRRQNDVAGDGNTGGRAATKAKGKGKEKAVVRVPKPTQKNRRQQVSRPSEDSDVSSEEDFTGAMDKINSDEEDHGGPSHPTEVIARPAGISPADIGPSPKERKEFLEGLSTVPEYKAMLDAMYSLPVSNLKFRIHWDLH
jgi:hypothetical protein